MLKGGQHRKEKRVTLVAARLSVGTFQNTLGTSCCKPEVEILE